MPHNYGPASRTEATVFGASRPGHNSRNVAPVEVKEWIQFMQDQGIERVVCLLPKSQLAYYRKSLLDSYREAFGPSNVLHAPIEDFHLSSPENLKNVFEFLKESEATGKKVVIHCSAGSGRTGHVLAAWLVHARGFGAQDAIEAVKKSQPSRNPLEAVGTAGITRDTIVDLLQGCATGDVRG